MSTGTGEEQPEGEAGRLVGPFVPMDQYHSTTFDPETGEHHIYVIVRPDEPAKMPSVSDRPSGPEPRQWFTPGQEVSFEGENPEPIRDTRVQVPPEEVTRRWLLAGFGVAWLAVFGLNIALALVLTPDRYRVVGAALGAGLSVLAGALGAGATYYFTRQK